MSFATLKRVSRLHLLDVASSWPFSLFWFVVHQHVVSVDVQWFIVTVHTSRNRSDLTSTNMLSLSSLFTPAYSKLLSNAVLLTAVLKNFWVSSSLIQTRSTQMINNRNTGTSMVAESPNLCLIHTWGHAASSETWWRVEIKQQRRQQQQW